MAWTKRVYEQSAKGCTLALRHKPHTLGQVPPTLPLLSSAPDSIRRRDTRTNHPSHCVTFTAPNPDAPPLFFAPGYRRHRASARWSGTRGRLLYMDCCERDRIVQSPLAKYLAVSNGSLDTSAAGTRGHRQRAEVDPTNGGSGLYVPLPTYHPLRKGGNNRIGQIVAGNLRAKALRGGSRGPRQQRARITMARIRSGTVSRSYARAERLAHWGHGGSRGWLCSDRKSCLRAFIPPSRLRAVLPGRQTRRKSIQLFWRPLLAQPTLAEALLAP